MASRCSDEPAGRASEATLTAADDGRSVDLRVGDRLVLRLHENASTGYRWTLDVDDARGPVLSVQALGFQAASAAVGSGGDALWLLGAQAPGSVTLRFRRWRPWEGEGSVLQRFTVTLQVRPA